MNIICVTFILIAATITPGLLAASWTLLTLSFGFGPWHDALLQLSTESETLLKSAMPASGSPACAVRRALANIAAASTSDANVRHGNERWRRRSARGS